MTYFGKKVKKKQNNKNNQNYFKHWHHMDLDELKGVTWTADWYFPQVEAGN